MTFEYLTEDNLISGKMGCMLAILGSTIMVIHAPKEEAVQDLQELGMMMMAPGFLIYAALALGKLLDQFKSFIKI